jgi:putative membrane protein
MSRTYVGCCCDFGDQIEEHAMKMKGILATVVVAALVGAPGLGVGQQTDPTMNPNPTPMNPQSPQNQNVPLNQPGYPTQTGSQTYPRQSMRDSLGAPGQTGQQMMDEKFVRAATEAGIADLKISELALQKGSVPIKDLAQKMISDHTTINRDLGEVADHMGVMLPKKMSKDQQAEYEKLNGLAGKDFDTEYVTYMARAHFQDLHSFHSEATAAADPALQEEVVKALHTMHEHLGLIKDTAKNENIPLPPPPPRGRRSAADSVTR